MVGLLQQGYFVSEVHYLSGKLVGYVGMTDYYDVRLKQRRHAMLAQNEGLSLRFSSSNAFRRRASDTSMPP